MCVSAVLHTLYAVISLIWSLNKIVNEVTLAVVKSYMATLNATQLSIHEKHNLL